MSKRTILAFTTVLVLALITLYFYSKRDQTTIQRELSDFAYLDTAAITKIFLADKAKHEVTLTRVRGNAGQNDHWMVNGKYPARPDAVRTLLTTIHDVSVRKPVGLKARETVIKQLMTGSTKIEIYAGKKLVKQYYVGGETPDMMGTYMLLSDVSDPDDIVNSTEPFETEIKGFNGYLTPRYFTNLAEWRDRTVFNYYVPEIRSIRVENNLDANSSFIVTQAAGSKIFGLTDLLGRPLPFDTLKLKQYISYFGRINFELIETTLKPSTRDSIIRSRPAFTIAVTDASNKKNEVVMFRKKNDGIMPEDTAATPPPPYDPDRMFALVNDRQDFVVVQYYVFGKLLPSVDYFLPVRAAKPVVNK
ncbi:MAG TPA: hypothetical protein VI731_06405 [Bacteroidia bacterium]|nr:hypothetical protein [Bacteroidia bacterium]